jgi:LysM repeat protein
MNYYVSRQCPPGTVTYTIKAGDTFFSLAQRFNTTIAAIIAANPDVDPENLEVGNIIFPSDDQPAEMKEQAAAVIRYPQRVEIGGQTYNFFILRTDEDHLLEIAGTVNFLTT